MILSMNEQIFLFFVSIAIGIGGGLLYGLICIFRKYIAHNILVIYLEDIFFWSIYSITTFLIMLCLNYGEIRPYILMGIFSGLILYGLFIHKYIIKILSPFIYILRLISEIILTPVMIVVYPFKKIGYFIKKHLKNSVICEKIKKNLIHRLRALKKR